ncbi:MAG: sigma-54 dependent transcriptional regulator [Bacteroidetes bacterium]|nr:sigma-54 dependent transcriptional regulator [Bacteroidota bacterium]
MESIKVFLVEDDPVYGEMLRYHLSLNPDYEVERFESGTDLIQNLYKNPAIISLDYSLPDMSGMQVFRKIKEHNADIPIVVVSGQEDVSTAINLLKEGAYDYIVKDNETRDRLWNVILHLTEKMQLKQEINHLQEEIGKKYEYENVIKGKSPVIKQIFHLIDKATKSNITVILTGETGTGKDLVAKAIHYNSSRRKRPFVAINVSAIPGELIESEMFGFEKGAFTGASTRKIGKFELAAKGTLFFDEIAEMDINMQTKLLRVLQEKEFTRIGGNEVIKTDVRLIVATNKNLGEEVQKGKFRQDLYYRLLGLPIELPPLRYRGNDILILAKHFVDEFCHENKMKRLSISANAQEKLMKYSYSGNVRELKAIMELACVMTNTDRIDEMDISFNASVPRSDFLMEENTLDVYNRKIIKFHLQKYNNNVLLVAKKLDIGKSTIYRMLKNKEI